jgi:hypothetical protein
LLPEFSVAFAMKARDFARTGIAATHIILVCDHRVIAILGSIGSVLNALLFI